MSLSGTADGETQRPLRVVMLAFEFPPLAAGGVYRPLAFARHLPACDCELDVVTVRTQDYAAWTRAAVDLELGCDLPRSVRVHRVASGFPDWYWRLTGSRLGFRMSQYAHWGDPVAAFWRRPLLECLDQLVAERKPDVILATVPPFGVAELGRLVARRYRLPWVVDFRDAWSRWCVAPYPSIAHYLYTRAAEGRILRSANVAIATSHVTRADWMSDHPSLDPSRLVTIYNGYEPADAIGARATRNEMPTAVSDGRRQIVYVGSFYYTPEARAATYRPLWRRRPDQWLQYRSRREDWLYRSPYFFLRGLRRLRDRDPAAADRLRAVFVGPIPSWLPSMLEETGTADAVTLTGAVPHAEALRIQAAADAVLLTSAQVDAGRDCSIAGKTFEYFAAGAPIVSLLTDGAMRDLVADSGLGLFAAPEDCEAVADLLRAVATAAEPRQLVSGKASYIARFSRETLVRQLSVELRRAAREGHRA